MSDVSVAPAGGAPAAAPTNEVVIETPASTPQPIGSQAPDKPVGDIKGSEHRPQSRREAIQAAFDRANNPPAKTEKRAERPAPKPADAKPGHNQPPEETKAEGLDLKKRPADQPRSERGQFAPRTPDERTSRPLPQGAQPAQQQAKPVNPLPATAPFREAPTRFSERGKAEWHAASENVRADVHRMESDFNEAYKRYRGDHEEMNKVRPFHDLATKHGTTLQRALTNYVNMETKLRQDPVGGLDVIVSNLNLRSPDGQKLTFRDIAYHVLSQSPEALKTMQMGNAQAAAQQQIGSLHAEIAGLKQTLQQMHTQAQFSYTRSAVDQFADAHPRFDELGDLIENELKFGFDLETAYRRAELLRPTTHAAQTRSASAQTRTADKSISGSPGAGPSNGTSRRADQQPVGRRDAIQNAIRRVGSGT